MGISIFYLQLTSFHLHLQYHPIKTILSLSILLWLWMWPLLLLNCQPTRYFLHLSSCRLYLWWGIVIGWSMGRASWVSRLLAYRRWLYAILCRSIFRSTILFGLTNHLIRRVVWRPNLIYRFRRGRFKLRLLGVWIRGGALRVRRVWTWIVRHLLSLHFRWMTLVVWHLQGGIQVQCRYEVLKWGIGRNTRRRYNLWRVRGMSCIRSVISCIANWRKSQIRKMSTCKSWGRKYWVRNKLRRS